MKKLSLALCILTLGSYAAGVASYAAGDVAAGKAKSATCAACHGADGNSTTTLWPKLAGQHTSYIVQQIKNFQSKARQDPSMSPMAAPLSEQDMRNLAAYFESQTTKIGSASPQLLESGQTIYRGGNKETQLPACIGCHGPNGRGNPAAKFPSLTGQHADYTVKQLKDYKSGARKPEGLQAIMMSEIAAKMSIEEMEAVANYMQGLH
jgi:cytochrome c553